ncbi:MAG: hypothetical protein JRN15_16715 [Nitrososphaerota archaeon]|nr:hypothetical protein [Nitrososphaerota archaeon]
MATPFVGQATRSRRSIHAESWRGGFLWTERPEARAVEGEFVTTPASRDFFPKNQAVTFFASFTVGGEMDRNSGIGQVDDLKTGTLLSNTVDKNTEIFGL